MNYQAYLLKCQTPWEFYQKQPMLYPNLSHALGADLSALFNLPVEDAMLKLQAGIIWTN